MSINVGLFGITGNPPHNGHMDVIKKSLKKVDLIWISLVFKHPFGKKFVDYSSREKMLNFSLEEFNFSSEDKSRIIVKNLDKEYFEKFEKTPYSYELLNYSKNNSPNNYKFSLIMGQDNLRPEIWTKYYCYDKIEKEFGVIGIKDQGAHSTEIRNLIKEENFLLAEKLMSKKVLSFIIEQKLYKE